MLSEAAFASFVPASLEVAQSAALLERVTSKFLVPTAAMAGFAQELSGSYAVLLAGGRPTARYRTLHFDTADLLFFHSHRRGRRRREKVRIRHYDDRGLSFFEVKQRLHALKTIKHRRPHAFQDNELHAEDLALIEQYTHARGRSVVSQVWTEFRRLNLVNLTALERVTVDFDVRFGDQRQWIDMQSVAIVEAKQVRLDRNSPIMLAMRARRCRPTSFSKYSMAITALRREVRQNLLRPQLRALRVAAHE